MENIVAIIGRPNVGKSTLFNRLIGGRKAIVDEVSGVTRDRTYGKAEWNGKSFNVIDTGGYIFGTDDQFEAEIRKQVQIAIDEADVLLFVVDVSTGVMDADRTVADLLRRSEKKALLVVNKVDNNKRIADAVEFYELGLGEYHCISSINGSGTGDLLDALTEEITMPKAVEEEDTTPKLAIVGRPNAGKSSLVNALLDKERNIVTPIAGTTRDAVHSHYKGFGFEFILIDTAGIRKKSKVEEDLEFYSVLRAIRAIEECDVCFLMLDAERGIEAQDLNIFHLAQKNRKGIVLLVNKWDLIEKDTNSIKKYTEAIKHRIAPFTDVPILFVSALTKQRVHKALETAQMVHENRIRKIKTNKLNNYILPKIEEHPPPAMKGKYVKIKFARQLPTHAPSFAFYCNLPQYVKEPYKRYLENQLRKEYDFTGVPINIMVRKK